ncbi:MAG TPA: hypothetical protein VF583_31175, partial [Bradyrhizobium sp.]
MEALLGRNTTVVPAKAGIHTPRRILFKGLVVPESRNNQHLWLWVPAFAGTTLNVLRGSRTIPHHSRG